MIGTGLIGNGLIGKGLLAPLLVGVLVSGTVTAFAAATPVAAHSIASGNSTVSNCSGGARVALSTAYATDLGGYGVSTVDITTASGCRSESYQLTMTDANQRPLLQLAGHLDGAGAAEPDVTGRHIAAAKVGAVTLVVTG